MIGGLVEFCYIGVLDVHSCNTPYLLDSARPFQNSNPPDLILRFLCVLGLAFYLTTNRSHNQQLFADNTDEFRIISSQEETIACRLLDFEFTRIGSIQILGILPRWFNTNSRFNWAKPRHTDDFNTSSFGAIVLYFSNFKLCD